MSFGFWIFLTLFCLFIQGAFSMLEMAAVSFNKARLHYYTSRGNRSAVWLNHLLYKPHRLFGTVLLGINLALQVGSESSRRMYEAIGLPPEIAPLTQFFLVMIFAELAPIFAARRFAEHVVMLGVPILYFISKLFAPFVWIMGIISNGISLLFKGKADDSHLALSREELQYLMEPAYEDDLSKTVANIFTIRSRSLLDIMIPLSQTKMLSSSSSLSDLVKLAQETSYTVYPIYREDPSQIIGLAYVRDLLRLPPHKKVREHCRPAWFITHDISLFKLLKQFRSSKQSMAIVLNAQGSAVGIITLSDLFDQIFGDPKTGPEMRVEKKIHSNSVLVERTFEGDLPVATFNSLFSAELPAMENETLSELFNRILEHTPAEQEKVKINGFEFTCLESGLSGAKLISIKSIV